MDVKFRTFQTSTRTSKMKIVHESRRMNHKYPHSSTHHVNSKIKKNIIEKSLPHRHNKEIGIEFMIVLSDDAFLMMYFTLL